MNYSVKYLEYFPNWKLKNLPKSIYSKNKDYSTINLSKKQRNIILQIHGYKNYNNYLQSKLWLKIRKNVIENSICGCGCSKIPNQVHHKSYTEANLLGHSTKGLVALNQNCHYKIEFENNKKTNLNLANTLLKEKQNIITEFQHNPSKEEINLFLSGKTNKLTQIRKIVVRSYLRKNKFKVQASH